MKALFVTTRSNDCDNHIAAWESFAGPSARVTFNHGGVPEDENILAVAQAERPAVIFYIGACNGFGLPSVQTFRSLRDIAPSINVCSDAMDHPWHQVLLYYKKQGCFDLQVAIDGPEDVPVDISTVTPVDPRPFAGPGPERDILCGFSGTVGTHGVRPAIITRLKMATVLTLRRRSQEASYEDHVGFLRRCKSVVNISLTGSGRWHHVKGRVLEAGWAGCALFEMAKAPTRHFLPADTYFAYERSAEILEFLKDEGAVAQRATRLAAYVRSHYRPEQIYGAMLKRVGLDHSEPRQAA